MLARYLLTLTFFASCHILLGQKIGIYKTFGGYRFEIDSTAVSSKMILREMESNAQAYAEFKKANSLYGIMNVMKFSGGALILFPIATAIVGGDPEWGLAAGGLVLLLGSIPINSAFQNHAVNGIDIFNKNPSSSSRRKLQLAIGGGGGSLVIKF